MKFKNRNEKIKYRTLKKDILAVVLVVMIAFTSETSIPHQGILQKLLWCIIAFVGIFYHIQKGKIDKTDRYSRVIFWFAFPFILATLYTLVFCTVVGDTIGTVQQSITTTLYIIVDVLMVDALTHRFGIKSVKIICTSIVLCYILTILLTINEYGIIQTILSLNDNMMNYIERHDVGVAVVPLLLMYLYKSIIKKNKAYFQTNLPMELGLFCILLLCGKRSAYLSLICGITVMLLFRFCTRREIKNVAYIICGVTYILCFVYIVAIRCGFLDFLNNGMGTMSDRYYVWKWFDSQYAISPFSLGKGFNYVHRYMLNGLGDGMVNAYGYLHNSILQIYIETGFLGFIIWFGTYFLVMPAKARHYCGKNTFLFMVILLVAMVAMFSVDNTLTYPLYQISLYISIYGVYADEGKMNIYEKNISNCCSI